MRRQMEEKLEFGVPGRACLGGNPRPLSSQSLDRRLQFRRMTQMQDRRGVSDV